MTDNEIIKNLENAAEWFSEHGRNTNTAIIGICKESVDLINRQKAEIEQLNFKILALSQKRITMVERVDIVNNARNKAIRELAVKLLSRVHKLDRYNCELPYGRQEQGYLIDDVLATIDNLVKEMTEDKKNDPE